MLDDHSEKRNKLKLFAKTDKAYEQPVINGMITGFEANPHSH